MYTDGFSQQSFQQKRLFPESSQTVSSGRFASPYLLDNSRKMENPFETKKFEYTNNNTQLNSLNSNNFNSGNSGSLGDPIKMSRFEAGQSISSPKNLPNFKQSASGSARSPFYNSNTYNNYQQSLNESLGQKVYAQNQIQGQNGIQSVRLNKDYQKEMYINLSNHMNVTEEHDIPQFVLFLLREENDNIANFRERIERDKAKVSQQLEHTRRQVNNLIDDLQTHIHHQIDQHFLLFMEKYKIFKQEIIAYKSISNDLIDAQLKYQQTPHQQFKQLLQPKQYLGKNNGQLIRELDEINQRNEFAKVQQYIHQCQATYINGLSDVSGHLMAVLSSPQPFFNFQGGEDTLENIKNQFAKNISQAFADIRQYVKPLEVEETEINNNQQKQQQDPQQQQAESKLIYSNYV